MVNKKFIDIAGLTRYNENLKTVLSKKQDVIEDLGDIRKNASDAAGAAADAAAQALADAKADAAEKYQVKGDYEAAGTAAGLNEAMDARMQAVEARMQAVEGREVYVSATVNQAIADAKDAALADAKTYADGLNTAMDDRVKDLEAIDHEKLAADAVATVLDGAPEKFDTLKEVAEWISNNESASSAADLVTRVAALEAIDHEAYIAADEVVLAAAKKHADDEIAKLSFDEAGTAKTLADAAEQNAKDYADGKFQVKGDYEKAGAAAQALADAKAYTDTEAAKKQDVIGDLETIRKGAAKGATAIQESDLQFATDGEIDALFA